ncbi:MAG TPA: hypothetical protein VJ957_10225 [Longimicrobiales bacterium]|nr:hypothetical protein [Longimicrobiales bacterium]
MMRVNKPTKTMWACVYQITPPLNNDAASEAGRVVDQENEAARGEEGSWVGRLIVEPGITRILVVSSSPEIRGEFNRKLEAALEPLRAVFSVTLPLALPEQPASP